MSDKEENGDELLVDMLIKGMRPESRYMLKHLSGIYGDSVGQYLSDMIDQDAVKRLGEGADKKLSNRFWRVNAHFERNPKIKLKAQILKDENHSQIDIGEP